VIATDAVMQREAEYRGLQPIHLPWGLRQAVEKIIGTDREELAALHGQASHAYPKSRLSEAQRRVLGLVRRLSQRVGVQREVSAYTLPPSILAQALYGQGIALDVSVLDDATQAVAAWLHETARVEYGAAADAVARMSAKIIVSYALR